MFKNDPVITYNHMHEERGHQHKKLQMSSNMRGVLLFAAETCLILLSLFGIVLLML